MSLLHVVCTWMSHLVEAFHHQWEASMRGAFIWGFFFAGISITWQASIQRGGFLQDGVLLSSLRPSLNEGLPWWGSLPLGAGLITGALQPQCCTALQRCYFFLFYQTEREWLHCHFPSQVQEGGSHFHCSFFLLFCCGIAGQFMSF